jgi:hypothetical protein
MLSPGEWYKDVPKEPRENAQYRIKLLKRAEGDRGFQDAIREFCSKDILFYVNVFAWTYQPKRRAVVPFLTYEFQDRALLRILKAIDEQEDLVIEKSREMGASWLCILAMEWLWHFVPWTQSLMVSRDANLVDGKTPDSLFWKIDFVHKWLPNWLMPRWDERYHRTKMYFENPDNGSTITGQATTEKIGIGGRATVLFLDEFSRVDDAVAVRDGTADTADCRIFNSTHTGPETAFNGLCTNGVTKKLMLHWTEHPEKSKGAYRSDPQQRIAEPVDKSWEYPADFQFVLDGSPAGGPHPGVRSPWYDRECARRGSSRAIAMDLDIDVSGSMSLFFDPLMLRRLMETCTDPWWKGDISFDRDTGKPVALVPSPSGSLKLWCHLHKDQAGNLIPAEMVCVIGADLSAGTGATPSCLSIVNCETGEKVGEYTNAHLDPKAMAPVATSLAYLFHKENEPAELIWEQQGPGISFAKEILELGFRRVYYRKDEKPHTLTTKVSERPGWVPRPETILVLLEDYRSDLATGRFLNRSTAALKECLQFRYTKTGTVEHAAINSANDPTGARTNHGDHVVADALAGKLARDRGKAIKQEKVAPKEAPAGSFAWRRGIRDSIMREEAWT